MIRTRYAVPFCVLVCLATGLVACLAGLMNPDEPPPDGQPSASETNHDE